MALLRKKPDEIPSDAVILTQDEAVNYSWKLISGWEDKSEIWALKFGPGLLGAISGATGVFINHHYRMKLKLGTYGRGSSYLPIVVLPAIMATVYHKMLIQRPIILNVDECPVCLQVRACASQIGFSVAYPTLLAPFAAFMFATRHFTYRLPSITENPKEVFELWRRMTRSITFSLSATLFGHAILASLITFKEMDQFYKMQNKLIEMEENMQKSV